MGPLLEGLIEYGKTQRIICSANAAGGATHMLAKAFFGEAGVDCEVLAADSGAQNALAVASGDAVCAIVAASAATQYIEDGSLKALACFSPEPFTGYEGLTIPTVKDMGYGVVFKSCNFLIAKKGTDQAVLDKIYSDMLEYRESEEFQALAANAAYIPDNQNAEQVRQTVADAKEFCENAFATYYDDQTHSNGPIGPDVVLLGEKDHENN